VRIDSCTDLTVERVTPEAAVADAGIGLVFQKAAVFDSQPQEAAAKQDVRLNPSVRQKPISGTETGCVRGGTNANG
jgi:hypothetical protein